MGSRDVVLLVAYSLGMSIGQVLFKLAATSANARPQSGFIGALMGSGYFYVSIALYGLLTVVWIWILTRIPLSRAYPFVILTFVFTPALAALAFGEQLDLWYFTGLALILSGLGVLIWKAG